MNRTAILIGLFAGLVATTPVRAWPTDPLTHVPVCTAQNTQHVPRTVSDGACGAIITWVDWRQGDYPDIYAQRLDGDGVPLWSDGAALCTAAYGQVRPAIAPDGMGGAIVAWIDFRAGQLTGDIYVQRVNGLGMVQWTANGIPLGAATTNDGTPTASQPCIVADDSGGAIIAWEDIRGQSWDIYAQRVNALGVPQWVPGGVPLCSDATDQRYPVICSDSAKGAIVAWEDLRNPGGSTDVYVQHVSAGGIPQWLSNGVPLSLAAGSQTSLAIVSDGVGGATVAWWDWGGGGGITARRINTLGTPQWLADGVHVCTFFSGKDNLAAIPDGTGGTTVAWLDNRDGTPNKSVFAGRIDGAGTVLSALAGVPICTVAGFKDGLSMVSDGAGGGLLAWEDRRSSPVEAVYAQRVVPSGALWTYWNADGVPVSLVDRSDTPVIASDGLGDGIISFCRATDIDHNDLYAARIDPSGYLGGGCAAYEDFGDAPEGVEAYSTGVIGHFPTCLTYGAPGTRELDPSTCTPRSTSPGVTGVVRHVRSCGVANPKDFWLGSGVDGEADGKVTVHVPLGGVPSACDTIVDTDCVGQAFGWDFGQDECVGDTDAGVVPPNTFTPCAQTSVWMEITNCQPTLVQVYINILVDWNHDGDWNDDDLACPGPLPICAHEWAVKNQSVNVWPGSWTMTSPDFRVGPSSGPAWMRVTISPNPVSNDFPWAGGIFAAGETEDYPMTIGAEGTSVSEEEPAFDVRMGPLFPNPSRDGTDITFVLPSDGPVSLAVFDVAGRNVRELARKTYPAGNHRVHWDLLDDSGREVRAGVYLVKLRVGARVFTRSAICVR